MSDASSRSEARESGRSRVCSELRDNGRLDNSSCGRIDAREEGRSPFRPFSNVEVRTVTSRETGVGVGGWSLRQSVEFVDDTDDAEPGITTVEASFFRALACTHLMSSAKAWRSETGRVRGTERGAVRGTVGGVTPRRPGRRGVKRWVAGGAECWRTVPALGLSVGGETLMAGGGSEPKYSGAGSIVHPTQRPHVTGAAIAMDGELVMVVHPTVVLKK